MMGTARFRMYFDRRLWQLTRGLRGRILLAIAIGLAAAALGIARFALLGALLARVFSGAGSAAVAMTAFGVAGAVLLRGLLDHSRTVIAHRTASRVQQDLRGRLYDKIAELGPAWFASERTGGVMLSLVDGVEQLQSFFGQYLPQVCVAALTPIAIFAFIAWWDVPVATVVLMAGTEVFRPLRDLRGVLHQGMVGQSAAAGIHALLAAEPLVKPSPFARPLTPIRSPDSVEGVVGVPTIAFEDVHFAYPGGRQAAHDGLTFTVAAGEKIGIVGPSGSGKSSIARLLLRLFDPQSGTVRVGGQDIRTLDPEALRRLIAIVHQDTYLFHGTVEENLRLGKPEATPAELEAAARDANAHEFIRQLPHGYQTVIGERGANLSGGQRQRLAIARALLRDAPILILDEALSSVDAENEAVIQQAIDRLAQGRTTLVLAHRLSSVIGADRILVLDHGHIVETGRHAELIRRDGPYRRLMGAQAEERGDDIALLLDEPVPGTEREDEATDFGADAPTATAAAAAQIGAAATLASLVRIIKPWAREFAVVVSSGIGRVAFFIGVGILGALAVAAVKTGAPFAWLLILLGLTAPLAGILHWIESWLAHDIAYRLLAEMRIDLYRKLDALAPAYLVRRRSGDLIALASQDIETVEYFFAHTVAPALVAILVPSAVLLTLAIVAWPIAA